MNDEERILLLSKFNYDYFNFGAVFSDETEEYRTPVEPSSGESVTLRIRVGKGNCDRVFININNVDRVPLDKMEEAISKCKRYPVIDKTPFQKHL